MNIPLISDYFYDEYVFVKDDVLYIYGTWNFRNIMYDLTYSIKDTDQCYYCSKTIKRSDMTLDHMYPQDIGGPTIPQNLCIACKDCNYEKSNMTEVEYYEYQKLSIDQKKEFRADLLAQRDFTKKWLAPAIPKEWTTKVKLEDITSYYEDSIEGKKCKKVETSFLKYGRIIKPVILDRNKQLVDGLHSYTVAKKYGIESVQSIILDNVELIP